MIERCLTVSRGLMIPLDAVSMLTLSSFISKGFHENCSQASIAEDPGVNNLRLRGWQDPPNWNLRHEILEAIVYPSRTIIVVILTPGWTWVEGLRPWGRNIPGLQRKVPLRPQ